MTDPPAPGIPNPNRQVPAVEDLPVTAGWSARVDPSAPTIDELADLVACYHAAGLAVDLDVRGSGVEVSPAVGTTLYRVAQESLANAARHGVGSADVRVTLDVDGTTIIVTNACLPASGDAGDGSGLIGMRERVSGLGGSFSAGPVGAPVTELRWRVEARLPAVPAVRA